MWAMLASATSAGCLLNTSHRMTFYNFSQNHFLPTLTQAGIFALLHLAAESTHNLYPVKHRTKSSSTLAEKKLDSIKQYLRIYWVFKISVLFLFFLEETPL